MRAAVPVPCRTAPVSMRRTSAAVFSEITCRRAGSLAGRTLPAASTVAWTRLGATYFPPLATVL